MSSDWGEAISGKTNSLGRELLHRTAHVYEGYSTFVCGRGRLRMGESVVLLNSPQSAARAAALRRASQFKQTDFDLGEQSVGMKP